jgi:hypothetical protein
MNGKTLVLNVQGDTYAGYKQMLMDKSRFTNN